MLVSVVSSYLVQRMKEELQIIPGHARPLTSQSQPTEFPEDIWKKSMISEEQLMSTNVMVSATQWTTPDTTFTKVLGLYSKTLS